MDKRKSENIIYPGILYVEQSLRKHTYSNIEKFSPPKTENFQIKNWYFFILLLKTQIVGIR